MLQQGCLKAAVSSVENLRRQQPKKEQPMLPVEWSLPIYKKTEQTMYSLWEAEEKQAWNRETWNACFLCKTTFNSHVKSGHMRPLGPGNISMLAVGIMQSLGVRYIIVLTAVVKIYIIRLELAKNLKSSEKRYGEMGTMFLLLNAVILTQCMISHQNEHDEFSVINTKHCGGSAWIYFIQ